MRTSQRPLWLSGVATSFLIGVLIMSGSSTRLRADTSTEQPPATAQPSALTTPVASEPIQYVPPTPSDIQSETPVTSISSDVSNPQTEPTITPPAPLTTAEAALATHEALPQSTTEIEATIEAADTATPDAPSLPQAPAPLPTDEAPIPTQVIAPQASFDASPRDVLPGKEVRLSNTSTGTITQWTWDFGDGEEHRAFESSPPPHIYSAAGVYTIRLRVEGPGGWSEATQQILVRPSGQSVEARFQASIDPNDSLRMCVTDLSSGSIARRAWDFGDGTTSTEANPCHTYDEATSYNVTLSVVGTNEETSTATQIIALTQDEAHPTAAFSPGKTSVVTGERVTFADQSTGIITAWAWDFGDGTTSSDRSPAHTYAAPGTHTVTLNVSGPNGSSSTTHSISVSVPGITCDIGVPSPLMADTVVTLTGSSDADTPADRYRWTVDGVEAGTGQDFVSAFPAGTYTIAMTAVDSNGQSCTRTRRLTFIAAGSLIAAFDRTPNPAAVGARVCFKDRSQGDVTAWAWNFGNGQTSTERDPCTTYTEPRRYTVQLIVTNASGQTSTATRSLDVLADQTLAIDVSSVSGFAPLTVTLTAVAQNINTNTLEWTFPGTIKAYGASVRYTFQAGDHTVRLTGSGPFGSSTATTVIHVQASNGIRAAFTPSRWTGTAPVEICFMDRSEGSISAWAWDFGNGQTKAAQNPCITYTQPGAYVVGLRVTDASGLSATASNRIRIEALNSGSTGGQNTSSAPTPEQTTIAPLPTEDSTPETGVLPTDDALNAAPTQSAVRPIAQGITVAMAPAQPTPMISVFDPSLSKIGYLPAGSTGLVGEALTWEVTVSNTTAVDETNVVISDLIRNDLHIEGVRVDPDDKGSATVSGQQVTVTFPLIAANTSYTFYIDTEVLTSPLNGQFNNRAISGAVSDDAVVTVPAASGGPRPNITGVPSDLVFAGHQYCFGAAFTNTGSTPGYGPYMQLILDPQLTYASTSFLNASLDSAGLVQFIGTFGAGGTLIDPFSDQMVSGTPGHRLYIISYPVGSVVPGNPDLIADICVDVDPNATPFVNLPIEINPAFRFGNTAIGENGSIVNPSPIDGSGYYRPDLVVFDKSSTVPEGERPPGAAWTYQYILTTTLASRQTITNLTFTDVLPNGPSDPTVEFVAGSVVLTPTGACTISGTPTVPNDVPNGGTLTVIIPTVANPGNVECTVSVLYSVYILDILSEVNNSTPQRTIINNATLNYQWQGSPRPPLSDSTTIVAENNVFQKSINKTSTAPNDSLVYRVDFQITQYASVQQLTIVDRMSAGVDFAGGAIFYGRTSAGGPGPVCGAGCPITVSPTVNGDGTLNLNFNVTAAAGAILPGGTGGYIQYNATVRETYRSSGAPILADDILTNDVVGNFQLVEGGSFQNDSEASIQVSQLHLTKQTITTPSNGVGFVHGETVTFRLTLDIPSGDTKGVILRDVFPLPVFAVSDADFGLNTPPAGVVAMPFHNTTGICATYALPPANPGPTDRYKRCGISYGPGTTIPTGSVLGVSVDPTNNAVSIELADISATTPQKVVIDITLAIVDQPFHYDLYLSNQSEATSKNTPDLSLRADAVDSLRVGGAHIKVIKGVIATTNSSAIFTPPALTNPPDNDLKNADTGDLVTYRITALNEGISSAYAVTLKDPQPAWLELCVFDTNSVRNGSGTPLAYTGSPLTAGGLVLTNALPGSLGSLPDAPARASFDVTCRIRDGVASSTVNVNTARADYRAYDPSVPNSAPVPGTYPPSFDDATVRTKRPAITKTANKTTATIGELITYTVTVNIGEGQFNATQLIDELPDNLAFVSCVSLTASGGIAGFAASCNPTVTNSGHDVSVPTGTLTVAATTGGGNQTITWVYTAVVLNDALNQAGTTFTNLALFNYDTTKNAEVDGAEITVVEPNVGTVKTRVTAGTFDAGDTLTFRIVVTNTGATAHDVVVTDVIPAAFTYVAGSATHTAGTAPATLSVTGSTLTATWTSLAASTGTSTITYQVTINSDVRPNQGITNTANTTYTSQPGTPLNTAHNALGVERTGRTADAGGAANDYRSSSSVTSRIRDVILAKSFISTNQAFTTGANVAIGEKIHYVVRIAIPEGETRNAVLVDTLDDGLVFVNLADVSTSANITIPAGVTSSAGGAAAILGAAVVTNNGRDLRLSLGNITNSNNNSATEIIVIEYDVVVITSAAISTGLNNAATFTYTSSSKTAQALDVTPRRPNLTIDKSVNPATGDAGDVMTFTLTITNPNIGNTITGQTVVLSDPMPANLNFVSVTGTTGLAPTTGPAFSAGTLTATWDSFPVGQTATITFTATLDDSVTAGQTVTNTATVDSSSLPGIVSTSQSAYNPNAVEAIYTTSDPATVTITTPRLAAKTVTASSFSGTSGTDLVIGEQVTYHIDLQLPEGSNIPVSVIDTLPTGLQYISSRVVSIEAGVAGMSLNAGDSGTNVGQDVTFDFGTINNPADSDSESIILEVVARVLDIPGNTDGTVRTNTATSNGTTVTADVTIREPNMTLAKAFGANPQTRGNTTPLTLTAVNTSALTAYDITISDPLDAGFSAVTGLTVTGGIGCAASSAGTPIVITATCAQVAPGATITVSATVRVDPSLEPPTQTLPNTATLVFDDLPSGHPDDAFDRDLTRTASATISVKPPETTLTKTGTPDPVVAGDSVQYTLNFTNNGSPDVPLTSVVMTDVLPNPPFTSASTVTVTSVTPGTNCVYTSATRTLRCTLATLPLNDTMTVVFTASVPENTPAGVYTNSVNATSAEGVTKTATTTTEVTPQTDLGVVKSVNNSAAYEGDTRIYTLLVTNYGPSNASNFTLNDTLPAGLTFIGAAPTGCTHPTSTTLACTLSLAAGASTTLTTSVLVGAGTAGQTLTNTVSVAPGPNQADSHSSNNTSTATVTVGLFSRIGDRVWIDANGDGVQDGTEVGADGMRVVLSGRDLSSRPISRTAITSGGGMYVFASLPQGNYTVGIDSSTLPTSYTFGFDRDGKTDGRTSIAITSDGLAVMDVDFGLIRYGSIGDLIWYDTDNNGVRDSDEGGIEIGTLVELFDATTGKLIAQTLTYGDGLYLFDRVRPGTYIVALREAPRGYWAGYDLDGSDDLKARFVLGMGQARRDVDFAVTNRRGRPPTSGGENDAIGRPGTGSGEDTQDEETVKPETPETVTPGTRPICTLTCRQFQLYHTNRTGDWEIFRLGDYEGQPDAPENLSQARGDDFAPSRSPDGNWIVFSSDRDGNRELYIAPTNGDSTLIQRVTVNTVAIDTDPMWGPANFIVYETTRDGNWNLYLFDVETGQDIQLTDDDASDLNAFWSPDGTHLLFQSDRSGQWQIYSIDLRDFDLRTTRPVLMSDGTGIDVDPEYSNDGTLIAFRSIREGRRQNAIYLMDNDGQNLRLISDPRGDALNHVWSPDDALIAYQSNLDGDDDIYVYDVATGLTRQVTDNTVADYAPTWICGTTTLLFTSEVGDTPDTAKDADIYAAPALPIRATAIDVSAHAQRMTRDPASDVYPQDAPAEENSSREARLPGMTLDAMRDLPSFFDLDVSATAPDLSIANSVDWTPLLLECRLDTGLHFELSEEPAEDP